jgi:flagellin-like protein
LSGERNMKTSMNSARGVSSVIGVVLMVAVAVILAAAVGTFALGFTNAIQEPAPQVANADAKLIADISGGGDQKVRITHRGGDTVNVSNLEIVVSFSDSSKRSRLVGIPTDKIEASDFEGDDIWDGRNGIGTKGALAPSDPEGADGKWSSGEFIEFRITSGSVPLSPGDRVYVKIVHEPSGNVLIDRTLTASAGSLAPVDALAFDGWSTTIDAAEAATATDADGAVAGRDVAFADPSEQRSYSRQSQSSTAAASRSWATSYETVAGWPPACP